VEVREVAEELADCPPGPETPFGLSSALRAHTKGPHENDLLWKTPRQLKRHERPRTVALGIEVADVGSEQLRAGGRLRVQLRKPAMAPGRPKTRAKSRLR
jgi:hypothetical protein